MQGYAAELERLEAALAEISEENMAAAAAATQEKLEASKAELDTAVAVLNTAKGELAGIESGDGRDESNRSMPERLRDMKSELVHFPRH